MALQHLRSSTAHKRPIPTVMSAGQIAINTNEASPALFFKDSNGDLVKVGPVHIGTDAPNSSPASVAATALVTGTVYQILTVGTTDFTLVGASANTVGIIFTATGTTTGTGTASGQQGVEKGEMWLDTTGGTYVLKIYDGSAWRSESGTFVDSAGDTMTGALLLDNAASASAPDLSFDGDADTGVYSPGANQVAVATNGQGRLFVDSNGRVGIGTNSPYAILDGTSLSIQNSSGGAELNFLSSTTGFGSIYFGDAVSGNDRYAGYLEYKHNDNYMRFATNTVERMRIDSSGNVGIGTSTPESALDVRNASISQIIAGLGAGQKVVIGSDTSTGAYIGTLDNYDIKLITNSTIKAVVKSGGNVGIGTTSPQSKASFLTTSVPASNPTWSNSWVSVGPNVGSSTGAALGLGYDSSGDEAYLVSLAPGVAFKPLNIQANIIKFQAGSSGEDARIDTSGRLLVGTSSARTNFYNTSGATAALQVEGTDNNTAAFSIVANTAANANAPQLIFGKSAGTAVGSNTLVAANVNLGRIAFQGNDGAEFVQAGEIRCDVDGTPGSNDMPGRLVFSTTADGASSPTERMRIDTAGRLLVNKSATASNGALAQFASSVGPHISVNSTGASSAFMLFQNSATGDANNNGYYLGVDGSQQAYVWNYSNTGIYFGVNGATVGRFIGTKFNVPGVYNGITTGGGPVYVESDGDLLRYTSSLKYKTDVETLEDARADAILNCRPVWYRSKCENDIKTEGAEKSDWGWYGFIAEEVAEIEPRLVNWATKDSVEQEDKTTLSVERDPADYEAEGVRYDNFVPLMLNLIKRQKAQIETLERRLSDAGIA